MRKAADYDYCNDASAEENAFWTWLEETAYYLKKLDQRMEEEAKTGALSPQKNSEYNVLLSELLDGLSHSLGGYVSYVATQSKSKKAEGYAHLFCMLNHSLQSRLLGDKVDKFRRDRAIAIFIEALIKAGAPSKLQSIKACSEWLGFSEDTLNKTHNFHRSLNKEQFSLSAEEFIRGYGADFYNFLVLHKEEFPKSFGKTSAAFKKVLEICEGANWSSEIPCRPPFSPYFMNDK